MTGEDPKAPTIEAAVAKIALGGARRHVFFCTHGDCAPKEIGEASWKSSMGPLGCRGRRPAHARGLPSHCPGQPIMLVYPEGTWYRTQPENIERIIQEHLLAGPVAELSFARNPLQPYRLIGERPCREGTVASAFAALGAAVLPFNRTFAAVTSLLADIDAITGDGKQVTLSRLDVDEELPRHLRGQLLLPDSLDTTTRGRCSMACSIVARR